MLSNAQYYAQIRHEQDKRRVINPRRILTAHPAATVVPLRPAVFTGTAGR